MAKQEKIGKALVVICKAGEAICETDIDEGIKEGLTDDLLQIGFALTKYLSDENKEKFREWLRKKELELS